jgi:hypothetical protein
MQALYLMISDKANVYFSIGIDRKVISAGLAAKNEKVLKFLGVDGLEYVRIHCKIYTASF